MCCHHFERTTDRSKKRGKSPTREAPPAPRATELAEPPPFLSEYADEGRGVVAELEGFQPVRRKVSLSHEKPSIYSCKHDVLSMYRLRCGRVTRECSDPCSLRGASTVADCSWIVLVAIPFLPASALQFFGVPPKISDATLEQRLRILWIPSTVCLWSATALSEASSLLVA